MVRAQITIHTLMNHLFFARFCTLRKFQSLLGAFRIDQEAMTFFAPCHSVGDHCAFSNSKFHGGQNCPHEDAYNIIICNERDAPLLFNNPMKNMKKWPIFWPPKFLSPLPAGNFPSDHRNLPWPHFAHGNFAVYVFLTLKTWPVTT